jgi:FKBP-type peptidyl-prolyl cis-trans isomerase
MNFKIQSALLLTVFMAYSARAEDLLPYAIPPDREKVSYALGMSMGLQVKGAGVDIDANAIAQAIKDVMEGKPTKIQDSEIPSLFRQAQAYAVAKNGRTNQTNAAPESKPAAKLPEPPDKEKFSYALGMSKGQQLKRSDSDVDIDTIVQAIKDVMEGKPTQIQQSEIMPLFRQAQAYDTVRQGQKNKFDGEAFLAANAKAPGIMMLPDGLQYRVFQAGTGEIPKPDELLMIKYRGSYIDGKEFDRNDHFVTRSDVGIKGWQDALQRMNPGSKWKIFVPPDLAYGHEGMKTRQVGPDATLIYELELTSVIPPGTQVGEQVGSGRLGHGLGQGFSPPNVVGGEQSAVSQNGQGPSVTNGVPPAVVK